MSEQDQRSAVVAEARSWLRTPYHHHGRIKGVGVDCLMLLAEVFERAGVVAHVEPGDYSTQWHLHRSEELYLGGLERYARRVQTPAPGDVAVYRFGRCFSHGAIVVGVEPLTLVHSYIRRGVIETCAGEEPLAGRDVQYWSVW